MKTRKNVPDWNDCVEGYFRTALFWHKLWQDGGRPESGVIGDIRKTTCKSYHKVRKMVTHQEDLLRSETNWMRVFRLVLLVKNFGGMQENISKNVDRMKFSSDIADMSKCKFKHLYNSTSSSMPQMDALTSTINDDIMNQDNSTSYNMLLITPDEVRQALQKMKPGKGEGEGDLTCDYLIYNGDVLCGHLSELFIENFVKRILKVKINYIYRFCLVITVEYIVTKVKQIH